LISGCDTNNDPASPSAETKTVEFYGIITPTDSTEVFRSFTYTNEAGGRSQSGVNTSNGTFSVTVQIKPGTMVELTATGYTTKPIFIGGNVVIYVDDVILAESSAEGRKGSNTVTVTAKIP